VVSLSYISRIVDDPAGIEGGSTGSRAQRHSCNGSWTSAAIDRRRLVAVPDGSDTTCRICIEAGAGGTSWNRPGLPTVMDPWYLRVEWLWLGLGAGALGMGAAPVFLI
jgi:hypothetical protein